MQDILDNITLNLIALDELTICSNKIIGGGQLIEIQEYVPLIIGAGETPKIWLRMKFQDKEITLINDNRIFNSSITIEENKAEKSTSVKAKDSLIIYSKMLDSKKCIITNLDLRPIGLDIVGNSKELRIAGTTLAGNTFSGTKFIIGMS